MSRHDLYHAAASLPIWGARALGVRACVALLYISSHVLYRSTSAIYRQFAPVALCRSIICWADCGRRSIAAPILALPPAPVVLYCWERYILHMLSISRFESCSPLPSGGSRICMLVVLTFVCYLCVSATRVTIPTCVVHCVATQHSNSDVSVCVHPCHNVFSYLLAFTVQLV